MTHLRQPRNSLLTWKNHSLPFGDGPRRVSPERWREKAYIVPMVARAIDISERLENCDSGLRVQDLHHLTGYSKTTIYRILRTLVAYGYVEQLQRGAYRIGHPTKVEPAPSNGQSPGQQLFRKNTDLESAEQEKGLLSGVTSLD